MRAITFDKDLPAKIDAEQLKRETGFDVSVQSGGYVERNGVREEIAPSVTFHVPFDEEIGTLEDKLAAHVAEEKPQPDENPERAALLKLLDDPEVIAKINKLKSTKI